MPGLHQRGGGQRQQQGAEDGQGKPTEVANREIPHTTSTWRVSDNINVGSASAGHSKITTSILLPDGREKSSNNVYKVKKNNLERGEVEE